jgi:hypothetical protein
MIPDIMPVVRNIPIVTNGDGGPLCTTFFLTLHLQRIYFYLSCLERLKRSIKGLSTCYQYLRIALQIESEQDEESRYERPKDSVLYRAGKIKAEIFCSEIDNMILCAAARDDWQSRAIKAGTRMLDRIAFEQQIDFYEAAARLSVSKVAEKRAAQWRNGMLYD